MTDRGSLDALREAVRVSPDNLPLRRHLAEQFLDAGLLMDAENAFREALALAPGDADLATGLAEAFLRQGKNGAAISALARVGPGEGPPKAGLVVARALAAEGDVAAARPRYWEAVARDSSLADAEFETRLGLPPGHSLGPEPAMAHALEDVPSLPSGPFTGPGSGAEKGSSTVTFADVAGMEQVKQSLRMKLLLPVQQPELFAAYGKRAGGGVMLYGPPGCGKTHLARAAAGELGAAFMSVGLSDILDMYIGSSERNLHSTFEAARRNRPCVLFFDEVDALAARRADMNRAHNRQIVNQFLAEMDGVEGGANEGVLVLAATNAPWYVDAAFRRPGRFDQLVFVPPPDAPARAAILALLCREVPLDELDFRAVSEATDGFAGADLKGVVDRAVEAKLQAAIRVGRPLPLSTADLLGAARAARPTAVAEWMGTARNYVMHANESGVWDELLPWFGGKRR
ncbi:AAA family ATPase [Actinomadura spongiicola]|uniref:AAA family ATPase n=1 Tax=Actinomadura spongiicola TaxID=2303421 RepID=A0A372GL03_9ACTN|nr:ATP-binding protein [Actinomadura spongiicola]RFS86066.1 AAA family ATPase [Actinomadura spongiicola]